MKIPKLNFFGRQARAFEKLITDNSPTILTGIGVVGVIGTSVLTWRATKVAEKQLADAAFVRNADRVASESYNSDPFSKAEKFSLVWKLYIAPVASGTLTIGCIVMAQKINTARAAALAGVLAMTQDDIKKYKEKVSEQLSGPKQQKLKEEMAKDRVKAAAARQPEMHEPAPPGKVWIVEGWTGRAILSTKETIRKAENDVNQMIDGAESALMYDFYKAAGFEDTTPATRMGWNTTNRIMLDWTTVELDDGVPAYEFTYVFDPIQNPHKKENFLPRRDDS